MSETLSGAARIQARLDDGSVVYWPKGYNLTAPDEENLYDIEQQGEVCGTDVCGPAKRVRGPHTMVTVYTYNRKETWILDNAKKMECP